MPYDVILVSNYFKDVEKNPNSFMTKPPISSLTFLYDYEIVCCVKMLKFSSLDEIY